MSLPSALSLEEQDELARSNKKVKDVSYAGFQGGLDSGSSSPSRGQGSWSRAISFKDKLVGEILGAFTQAFNFGDCMDDDEASDEEVEVLREGLAAVKFSKEFKQHICTPWSKALIVKVFGRTVGFSFLHSRLLSMWKPAGRLDCVGLGHGFFLVRLSLKEDYENILRKGPWFIAVWIRLNELPIEYYNVEALLQIGKSIGNVLRIDTHTASEAKGRFARLCVHIDIDKPLITAILIGKFEQPVCYEGIQKLCFSCGRMGHRRENCSYTIRQCSQGHKVETVVVEDKGEQSRKEHGLDNAKTSEGSTKGMQEDVKEGAQDTLYGPWVVVGRKKNGTKSQRSGGTPSGNANGHLRQMQETRGNGVNANLGLGKVEPNNRPSKEAKRKLSPSRVVNKAQLASSLQTIRTGTHAQAQTPSNVSPKKLDVDNMDFRVGNEVKSNHKASVKAKKVLAHSRAFQGIPSLCNRRRRERLKQTCGRESNPRAASQLQLSSMPWPEVGYKFQGDSSGKSRGGDRKNVCKFGASHGVVQQQITKGIEVDLPSNSGKCDERRNDIDRTGVGRGGEARVADPVDGGGAANDLGSSATEANSSLLAKCDVQSACTVLGDGGGDVPGYVEADRMEFEGGGEVGASC
ncbi:hypothetical protein SO802_006212 [Lithocarpus litseifolius]|uniref:CCHC-type domain-containing protein n=1 Tax=Lithocarpus litseifolius TaxID=425828 RepID=A0AAW2DLU7_9ROSI